MSVATRTKKATSKKRRRPQNKARASTVKRAAMLKKLTKSGGRKRARAKTRLKQAGATGEEW
jgi:hypothetical protein